MSRRAAVPSVLALIFALVFAPSARADSEAEVPRDPDFYQPPDIDVYHYVPMPDLASRPRPRDSRKLSGAFAPDPQGTLRYFTVAGAASSPCIGEPVSALCAVETLIAGGMSNDTRLQKLAFGPFAKNYVFVDLAERRGETKIYRVYDVKVLGPEDLKGPRPYGTDPWYPRWYAPHLAWKVGDVQIQILSMMCASPEAKRCSSGRIPTTNTVREVAPGRWAVLSGYRARF